MDDDPSVLPLQGVRILSVEQYGAGPFATMLLADLGAEVIKIEDRCTGGDVARSVPPYRVEGDSLYFQSWNRNKKSITLNLKDQRGKAIFHRLVCTADAVFNNLRGDVPSRLGLDYAALRAVKPAVVCASLSAFGRQGERAAQPGYDYLMQGYAGWMSLTGEPDGPPQKMGLSLVDLSGGALAALGLMSAIFHARKTGRGSDVDVNLFHTALFLLTYVSVWHLNAEYEPVRMPDSAHPSQVPSQIFPTRDGWLVVMCAKEKFYRRFVEILGVPELASDPRFSDFEHRFRYRNELIPLLKMRIRERTTAQWLALLEGHVPCAPVNTVAQALQDSQVQDQSMLVEVEHPTLGILRQVAAPIELKGARREYRAGPTLGEHNREIYGKELGIVESELAQLKQNQVL